VANLTLTIDDDLLRRARVRALESGTTVNALVRHYLEAYGDPDSTRRAMREFGEIADRANASSGPGGRTWTREELYEDTWAPRE